MPHIEELKFATIGHEGSGKTAFVKGICDLTRDPYGLDSPTHGDIHSYDTQYLNHKITVLDGVGREDFQPFVTSYLPSVNMVLVVVDPTVPEFETHKKLLISRFDELAISPVYGFMLVFTHYEKVVNNNKFIKNINNFVAEFSELKLFPLGRYLSGKNTSKNDFFSEVLKLINNSHNVSSENSPVSLEPTTLDEYIADINSKVDDYVVTATNRFFYSTDRTRYFTAANLKAALKGANDTEMMKTALIAAARDIRKMNADGTYKYGFTIFGYTFGTYRTSHLYRLIKAEMERLDPEMDLAFASAPVQPAQVQPQLSP